MTTTPPSDRPQNERPQDDRPQWTSPEVERLGTLTDIGSNPVPIAQASNSKS